MSEVASTECKMSEVALLAPTYEHGYVGVVCGCVFHSDSIITRGLGGWKGDVGFGTIRFMYVSCMFQFSVVSFQFSVFCQNRENKQTSKLV